MTPDRRVRNIIIGGMICLSVLFLGNWAKPEWFGVSFFK